MPNRGYSVKAAWDAEAHAWYVAESDIPGLNTEGKTLDALIERAKLVIPELLELNGLPCDPDLPIQVEAMRTETLSAA